MVRHANHHSRIKALLLTTALTSGFATGVQAQQVIDTPTTSIVSLNTGETLLITDTGGVEATAIQGGNGAIIVAPSAAVSITNHGFALGADSSGGDPGNGIHIRDLGELALVNTGFITGETNGINCVGRCTIHSLNNSGEIRGRDNGIRLLSGNLENGVNSGGIRAFDGAGWGLSVLHSGGLGGLISDFRNTGTGVIQGGSSGGIAIAADALQNFVNEGLIGDDDAIGIMVFGNNPNLTNAVTNFTNATGGVIRGFENGIRIDGDVLNFANHGTIDGSGDVPSVSAAVNVNGALTGFTNTGLIENIRNMGPNGWAIGVRTAGVIDGFHNSGTIRVRNSGNSYNTQAGVFTEDGGHIASLSNAGHILAEINAADPLLSGYAIREGSASGGGATSLYLLPGSVLQGRVYLGNNAGTDTLYVGQGLNLALTDENSIERIETGGALTVTQVVNGNNTLVAVSDTSVLSASDNAQSAIAGALSGIVAERLATDPVQVTRVDQGAFGPYGTQHNRPDWWAKGFGGVGHLRSDGPAVATNYVFGGLAAGADLISNNGLRYGLFAGASTGHVKADVANGQELDNNSFFISGYGRYEAQNFYLNYGLTAGYTKTDSSRIVGNNLVLGGLETASASYGSYFLAPEVTIGSENWQIGQMGLQPSLRLRYTYMQSDGYTETGLTDGNLTVSDRDTHVIDARAQLAMPMRHFGPDTDFGLRVGVDGHFVMGGDFDATLLGQTTSGFDAGGASSSAFGFVGVDVEHRLNDTSHLFLSAEAGTGTETSFAGTIEAGFRMKF